MGRSGRHQRGARSTTESSVRLIRKGMVQACFDGVPLDNGCGKGPWLRRELPSALYTNLAPTRVYDRFSRIDVTIHKILLQPLLQHTLNKCDELKFTVNSEWWHSLALQTHNIPCLGNLELEQTPAYVFFKQRASADGIRSGNGK